MRSLGIVPPAWVSKDLFEAEAVAFCAGLMSCLISQLGRDSSIVAHKAHVSRKAFVYLPFERKLELPTCGRRNRVAGFPLNTGDTGGFEAVKIRVTADERQRGCLQRALRLAAGGSFALQNPSHRTATYRYWMASEHDERMFYIPHAILVLVVALVACCAGYGAIGAKRSTGEVLDWSISVFGGKDTAAFRVMAEQHAAMLRGGADLAMEAHHIGATLVEQHQRRAIRAAALFLSLFVNTLPALVFVGVGCQYHVIDADGKPIYMIPCFRDVRTDFRGRCAACAAAGVGDEPEPDPTSPQETTSLGPASLPAVVPAARFPPPDDGLMPEAMAERTPETASEGARERLRLGRKGACETYHPAGFPTHACLNTGHPPTGNYVARGMNYLPDLAAHEARLRDSSCASHAAGDVVASLRHSMYGRVLLLDTLQKGAFAFADDADVALDVLDESNWMQRAEAAMQLQFPVGQLNPSDLCAYEIPAHTHQLLSLVYGSLFQGGSAYSHAQLSDSARLHAAALLALLVANLDVLRSGPPSLADRVEAVAGVADATHLLLHFFDGRLEGGARRAMLERGMWTVRRVGHLAMRLLDPDGVTHRAPRPCAPRTSFRSAPTLRARAMVILSSVKETVVESAFRSQRCLNSGLERACFDKHLRRLVERLLGAMPTDMVTRMDGVWISALHARISEDADASVSLKIVGRALFDDFALALTGAAMQAPVVDAGALSASSKKRHRDHS